MDRILKKINYSVIIFIILLVLFSILFFSPLKAEFKISLENNFQNMVNIVEVNVDNKISRYIEGAESISNGASFSRLRIRWNCIVLA